MENPSFASPFSKVQIIQVIVVAGVCVVALGFMLIILTLPVQVMIEAMTDAGTLSSDASSTVYFYQMGFSIIAVLVGLGIIAWGWIKSVEEREFGFSTP